VGSFLDRVKVLLKSREQGEEQTAALLRLGSIGRSSLRSKQRRKKEQSKRIPR
jgi:hypothetical protein